jgi:hypothetical protein
LTYQGFVWPGAVLAALALLLQTFTLRLGPAY